MNSTYFLCNKTSWLTDTSAQAICKLYQFLYTNNLVSPEKPGDRSGYQFLPFSPPAEISKWDFLAGDGRKSAVAWGMPTLWVFISQTVASTPQKGFKSDFLVVYGGNTKCSHSMLGPPSVCEVPDQLCLKSEMTGLNWELAFTSAPLPTSRVLGVQLEITRSEKWPRSRSHL